MAGDSEREIRRALLRRWLGEARRRAEADFRAAFRYDPPGDTGNKDG